MTSHQPPPGPPAGIDTARPNPARVYYAPLGGKDHYLVDRAAADAILKAAPQARQGARENRAFLQRAVRYLAQQGIRQFLDIGTGLPTQGNVHQIARQVAPDARVIYVDDDPVVHVHANALLANNSPTTLAVLADLRESEAILDHAQVRGLLDFTQPIGVLLVAVLHFVRDEEDPAGIIGRLRQAMAPGSFLVISHATGDFHPQAGTKVTEVYQQASAPRCCAAARRSAAWSGASTWSSPARCSRRPGALTRSRPVPARAASTAVLAGAARRPPIGGGGEAHPQGRRYLAPGPGRSKASCISYAQSRAPVTASGPGVAAMLGAPGSARVSAVARLPMRLGSQTAAESSAAPTGADASSVTRPHS